VIVSFDHHFTNGEEEQETTVRRTLAYGRTCGYNEELYQKPFETFRLMSYRLVMLKVVPENKSKKIFVTIERYQSPRGS